MKKALLEYINLRGEENKLESIEDEAMVAYMQTYHKRWYSLAAKYGNPLDNVLTTKRMEGNQISKHSAQVSLVSQIEATKGKTLKKKLLNSMTVGALKNMICKLFKVEVLC